ncbi:MAG: DNA-3-methyladenine glycosylase I [Candidatus Eisenbacteria bacterium]
MATAKTAARELVRCPWPKASNALYVQYHDTEWGVPEHDDRALFEKLILDGAQAGLSWETILNKRENYRRAFEGFEIETVAGWGTRKIEALMKDAGIVRNRQKITSAIGNARVFLDMQAEFGSFDAWLWGHVDGVAVQNRWTRGGQIPARTELSDAISKALHKRGMRFVGSTIIYAYLQAIGVVNDHLVECFRHAECAKLAARPAARPAARGKRRGR